MASVDRTLTGATVTRSARSTTTAQQSATVRYMTGELSATPVRPGELIQAGDIILTREKGVFGALIRYGTKTGAKGINHAAIVAEDQAAPGAPIITVEAMASGVVETSRSHLTGYVFRPHWGAGGAHRAVEIARGYLGTPYDWIGIMRFATVCLRRRWWGHPIAWVVEHLLPKHDDPAKVFCSDHIAKVLTQAFGDLGLGPTYQVAPVDLLRYFVGYGTHLPRQ